eukprot:513345-Pelagomonas_calceolata.AAC.1
MVWRVTASALIICRGLHAAAVPPQLLSRPRVLTVLDSNQVNMLLVFIQLVRLSHALSCGGLPCGPMSAVYHLVIDSIRMDGGESTPCRKPARKELRGQHCGVGFHAGDDMILTTREHVECAV